MLGVVRVPGGGSLHGAPRPELPGIRIFPSAGSPVFLSRGLCGSRDLRLQPSVPATWKGMKAVTPPWRGCSGAQARTCWRLGGRAAVVRKAVWKSHPQGTLSTLCRPQPRSKPGLSEQCPPAQLLRVPPLPAWHASYLVPS